MNIFFHQRQIKFEILYFLGFAGLLLSSTSHLMCAIIRTQATTQSIGLISVKNSTHRFCLRHFLLDISLQID